MKPVRIFADRYNFCEAQAAEKGLTVQEYINYLIAWERERIADRIKESYRDSRGDIENYPDMAREMQRLDDQWYRKQAKLRDEEWENGPDDHRLYDQPDIK